MSRYDYDDEDDDEYYIDEKGKKVYYGNMTPEQYEKRYGPMDPALKEFLNTPTANRSSYYTQSSYDTPRHQANFLEGYGNMKGQVLPPEAVVENRRKQLAQIGRGKRKLKKKVNKKQPSENANKTPLGTLMRGGDGKMYMVKKQWCLVTK